VENIAPIARLKEVVAQLRAPDGCPWDREQTHSSLRAALIEESHEVIEAIDNSDDTHLREELGDILLQVVMHSQMASERDAFTLDDVASVVADKMVRRHPHVFGDKSAADSDAVLRQWDQIKRTEKGGQTGALDSISTALPALLRAQNAQKKAGRVGFDWPDVEPVYAKIVEETEEIREAVAADDPKAIEAEIGDLLFSVVNLARKLGVDAETSLAGSTRRFIRRFQAIESELRVDGKKMEETPLDELDRLWEKVKRA
jgi:MazG family protein